MLDVDRIKVGLSRDANFFENELYDEMLGDELKIYIFHGCDSVRVVITDVDVDMNSDVDVLIA